MAVKKSQSPDHPQKAEIDYPCIWQYKVIGKDSELLEKAIIEICSPVPVAIRYSHSSSGGKYHSFNAEIEVQDEEARLSIYRALHSHPAVTYVL